MAERLKAPRGTADVLPPQTSKWVFVEDSMRRFASRFGYEEIRTPIFELSELFNRSIGEATDIVTKEMYTFTDKGGRSNTLRPEMTASSIRAYLEHELTAQSLVKWFYIGPGFRYERPQNGRLRQFHQLGVEAIGSKNPALDAEVIALAVELFSALGLKNLDVKINSIGCRDCRPPYREKLRAFIQERLSDFCEDCRTHRFEKNPLRILDCKIESCQAIVRKAPTAAEHLCENCVAHFTKLKEWLERLHLIYTLDPLLVRGLEYYTRTVFEVVSKELGAQNTICGGGRYDDLVLLLGGPQTPAVGFAAGIERIIMTMETSAANFPEHKVDLYVVSLGERAEEYLLPVMMRLRRSGFHVRGDYNFRSIGAQLKEADRFGARWSLLLGDNELAKKTAILRNMESREQIEIPLDRLEQEIIGEMRR